ncbi:MAG: hypothetical protein ABIQ31_15735 [Ferruginibacter sp.]
MKKIVPILLFIVICVSHLHIFDAIVDFNVLCKKENTQKSKDSSDKESEPENEDKGKEKGEAQEKFYARNHYPITSQFQLPGKDKFICFNTKLNKHPYNEDDLQPPKAA